MINHFPAKFQCWSNVVSKLWINVEITLIRRWKWNKIRHWIFSVLQRWYNVGARRWNKVESKSHNFEAKVFQRCTKSFQRFFHDIISSCFNVALTSVKAIRKPTWLVRSMNSRKDWKVLFYQMKIYSLQQINYSVINKPF